MDKELRSGSSGNGAPRNWSLPDKFINQNTCRKSTVGGIFSHPCFSSSSTSACGSVCLPVCRGRCSISLTRFILLWFSLISKLPLVSKSLQGLRVEIGPQLEWKMRGPDQKHRCTSQQSLHASCVAADEIGDCNGFHFPFKACCTGRLE